MATRQGFSKSQLRTLIDQEAKKRLRRDLKKIAAEKKAVRSRRGATVGKVRERCRAARRRGRERVKAIRKVHQQIATNEARATMQALRAACSKKVEAAHRRAGRHIAALKAAADRRKADYLASRLKPAAKRDAEARISAAERRAESDDEVARNLDDPAMVRVFKRRATQFKPRRGRSRTESFLEWVEENPDEVQAEMAHAADQTATRRETEIDRLVRRIEKLLTKRTVSAADLEALRVSCPYVEELGLSCRRPRDVVAAAEVKHLGRSRRSVGVPF